MRWHNDFRRSASCIRFAVAEYALFKVCVLTIAFLFTANSSIFAQGNGNGNGNGGGGGKQDPPAMYRIVETPIDGHPGAMSESDSGVVVIAIDAPDEGYGSSAFVRVNPDDQTILAYGFLPEPLFIANDGTIRNGPSAPWNVNKHGVIVGSASAFEDHPDYHGDDLSPQRAIIWTWNGTDYELELLPSLNLAPTVASSINNWGEIVGQSDGDAVYWDPLTRQIGNLNTAETLSLGWDLIRAVGINDAGQVIGLGRLAGKLRGFLLDLNTAKIWPVPLIGPADANTAIALNEEGTIVGAAWDGEGVHYGTNPDYVQAYSWNGPGTDPVILPSITNNTSIAFRLNDRAETIGNSYIPDDNTFDIDMVPTHWQIDEAGRVTSSDLTKHPAIDDSTWSVLNGHDVNNDGWISVYARKRWRGNYRYRALILVPNQ